MANIRVDLPIPIYDGMPVTFKAPADCSEITGLRVYYPESETSTTSQDFTLSDANRNNVGNINNLFTANAIVKVILDTDEHMAFIQNADTNAYLEGRFNEYLPLKGGTLTGNLQIEKTTPEVIMVHTTSGRYLNVYVSGDGNIYFRNALNSNTRTSLYLMPETATDWTRAVRLQKMINGTADYYNIFGEHNVTCGTADLTAGTSPLSKGSIYQVYK